MQLKKQQQSIVYEQTIKKFELQLQIINKIMENQLWIGGKHLPSIIVYQISTYVFTNPIRLKTLIYSTWIERTLKINQKYMIKGRAIDSKLSNNILDVAQRKSEKSSQKSAFITIIKQWKALDTRQYGYAQVIQKGRFFLSFLSNIKIKVHPQDPINYDPLQDFDAFKRQQSQKNKHYTLISDNFSIIIRQFEEIFQYQKSKKINDVLIRTFISLMNHNIAIVKIQENYNTSTIGCEGRYVYVANMHQLPFIKIQHSTLAKENLKLMAIDFPWLQIGKNGEWRVGHSRHHGVNVYRQQTYPLKRGRRWLINKKLEYFLQNDVWISNS